MRLDTFLIADAIAAPADDGKFYIHGGGLSRFEVPVVPFPMPLHVLIRLEVSDEELLSTSHHLLIKLIGPAGLPNIPPINLETGPEKSLKPILDGEQRFLQLALSLPALVVRVGVFHLELHVDGKKLGSIPLPVKLADNAQVMRVAPGSPARLSVQKARAKRPSPPPKKTKRRR
jgi:hypothetical protein